MTKTNVARRSLIAAAAVTVAVAGTLGVLGPGVSQAAAEEPTTPTTVVDCYGDRGYVPPNPDGTCPTEEKDVLTSAAGDQAGYVVAWCTRDPHRPLCADGFPPESPARLTVVQGERLSLRFADWSRIRQVEIFASRPYPRGGANQQHPVRATSSNPATFEATFPAFPVGDNDVLVAVELDDGSDYAELFFVSVRCRTGHLADAATGQCVEVKRPDHIDRPPMTVQGPGPTNKPRVIPPTTVPARTTSTTSTTPTTPPTTQPAVDEIAASGGDTSTGRPATSTRSHSTGPGTWTVVLAVIAVAAAAGLGIVLRRRAIRAT